MVEARNARMYDEHQPPRPGIEEEIMNALKTKDTMSPKELLDSVKERKLPDSTVRERIWSLIDRGYIELTRDRQLKGHTEPINPAPVDFV